jgi:hypothetical protein
MATSLIGGPKIFSLNRDEDSYREYKIKYLVRSSTGTDGPSTVLHNTPGLPQPYTAWIIGSDTDLWAWCKWEAEVEPAPGHVEGDPVQVWQVGLTFTTKPPKKYCRTVEVQNPLLEPVKVSGTFVKYTEEATRDRFGAPINNSAHEQIRGPQVEFDKNRATVKIEMPVAQLKLDLVTPMIDTVNSKPLWGLPERCIKLSNFTWERKYYAQCSIYYTWTFDFDIRFPEKFIVNPPAGTGSAVPFWIGGFDRLILDEGTKVLNGNWDAAGNWQVHSIGGKPPDPLNPQHFKRFQDRVGNTCRVILNGMGLPADVGIGFFTGTGTVSGGAAGQILVQKYDQNDFTILGIPLQF